MSVEGLLACLDGVKQTGSGKWMAKCPAHQDRSPSLSIKDEGGTTLVHCFGGCQVDDVLGAVGMSVTDLFPPSDGTYKQDAPKVYFGGVTFTAADALRCLAYEAGACLLLAADMAEGHCLSPDERERLYVAVERLNEACIYTGAL